nr:transposase (putative), gypsy type [Tanacetum cinerariifolium]
MSTSCTFLMRMAHLLLMMIILIPSPCYHSARNHPTVGIPASFYPNARNDENVLGFPVSLYPDARNVPDYVKLDDVREERSALPIVRSPQTPKDRALDTHRTPIQKQPEALLCLVGISRRYYLGDDVYLTFHYDDDREMDLFGLIRAPNPTKVKTGSRPRAPHELSLLTLTASRVIEMDEPAVATDSSGVPSAIEKSPLDFADKAEASGRETAAPEMPPPEEVPLATVLGSGQAVEAVVAEPPTVRESRKRGPEGVDANAPPKSLRRDHTDRPSGVAVAEDPGSENASSPIEVLSPRSVYRPEWGVTNGSLLDTPEACQDLVDHAAPPSYFAELRHMPNDEFLRHYNVNLARQVAMGSQLRL